MANKRLREILTAFSAVGWSNLKDRKNRWTRKKLPSNCEKLWLYNICSCLLYTSPSPRDRTRSRMPSSA